MLRLRDARRRLSALVVVASTAVLSIAAAGSQTPAVAPDPGSRPGVLLLISDEPGRPHVRELVKGFTSGFEAQPDATVYVEYLDLYRFADLSYRHRLGSLLATRYRGQSIDVAVAVGAPGLALLAGQSDAPWAAARVLYSAYDGETPEEALSTPGATGMFLEDPLPLYLQTIRTVLPGTRGIALVYGATEAERGLGAAFATQAARAGIEILDLGGLTLEETRRRLSTGVPDGWVVFIRSFRNDAAGRTFSLRQPCELLADAAARPVFMFGRFNLGCGIVGGPLTDYGAIGRWFASETRRQIARGTTAPPVLAASAFAPFAFDARQLSRWSIPENRLPPGSQVLFEPRSLWRDYRRAVIAAGLLVAGIALLVIVLLVERERRQGLQRALGLSYSQVRRLGGRVIAAREAERAQIARDLHDDVSQSLALLSIQLDRIRAEIPEGIAGDELRGLAARATGLQNAVQALSHQLHPARLQTLGLVAAIRGLSREVSAAGFEAAFEHRGVPDPVPSEIGLCLFRVAEEALHNAARHSGAGRAVVTLTGEPGWLCLDVSDAGRGFLPYAASAQGVGIASIRERVRYFEGECRIESGPASGTRVFVRLPCLPAAGAESPAGEAPSVAVP